MKHFLFLILLTVCFTPSRANHVIGGEIQVDVLKPDTFVVMMTVFRECNGTQTDSVLPVSFYSFGCTPVKSATAYLHLRKTNKADFLCSDSLSACNGGSFPFGVQARVYIDTFYTAQLFPTGVSCCDLYVFYQMCCRNAQVSPPFPGPFHFETKFNRCVVNRAPRFTDYPLFVAKAGFYFNYSRGIIDTTDVDSFSFEEVAPLTGHDTDLASPFWSSNNPIYLGYPFKNLPCPASYQFNTTTNDWFFRPSSNFPQALAFQIKEWKMVNNAFVNVSTIRREVLLTSYSTSPTGYYTNNSSIQLSSNLSSSSQGHVGSSYCYAPNTNYFQTRVGQQTCFYIKAAKASGNDSIRITWNGGLPGAVFNSVNKNSFIAKGDSASICWTPDFSAKKDAPYYFTYKLIGQECPIPSQFSQTVLVKVHGFVLNRSVTKTGAGQYFLNASVPSIFNSAAVTWAVSLNRYGIFDSTSAANYSGNQATHSFTANGKYVVRSRFTYPPYGTFNFYDTVTVCDFSPVAQAGADTTLCKNNSLKLTGSPIGGIWSGATLQNDTFKATFTGNYVLLYTLASDTFGCTPHDTLKITVRNLPAPVVISGADTTLCKGSAIALSGTPAGGIWSGQYVIQNVFAAFAAGLYPVTYTYTDSFNCTGAASTQIKVKQARSVSFAQAGLVSCTDTGTINLDQKTGALPLGGSWFAADTSKAACVTNGLGDLICLGVSNNCHRFAYVFTDTNQCTSSDSVCVLVQKPPVITANVDTVFCEQGGWVPLSSSPLGGSWTAWGLGMSGNLFNASQSPGPYQAFYSFTDSNGCSNVDTTKITIIHAAFTPSVSSGFAPLFVTFSNTSDSLYTNWLWNFGNGISDTSNLKNPSYTFTMSNRWYQISLIAISTTYGCSTTVNGSVSTNATGVPYSTSNNLVVYPNPAKQTLTIESVKGLKHIKLTDLSGRSILQVAAESSAVILQLPELAKGVYLLSVTGMDGLQSVQKLVIE